MAIIPFNPNYTWPYSLKRDTDNPTVFLLGPLDGALRAHLDDNNIGFSMNQAGGDKLADINWKNNQRNLQIVRFGVRGWENFNDANGKPLECELQSIPVPGIDGGNRKGLTLRSFNLIDPNDYAELANAIMAGNRLTAEESKNSEPPSS